MASYNSASEVVIKQYDDAPELISHRRASRFRNYN